MSRAPILVTGFGPFLDVTDNPSAELVRALDGRRVGKRLVIGRVLPVSYGAGIDEVLCLAVEHRPRLVLGFGVARSRDRVEVERVGRRVGGEVPDAEGVVYSSNGPGPEQVPATLDISALARALDAGISEHAGSYVCNAWAYRVPLHCGVPAAFVHVPPTGLEPERVLKALEILLSGESES